MIVSVFFSLKESDLLELHRSNIQAFHQFMFFVKMDENISNAIPDFGPEFAIIEARLSRVLAGIEAVVSKHIREKLPDTFVF